ncbi:TetR/AcrR family transcriptional regulator [Pengzhenrongella sicca]|uniref:TetR/AcrR family transcriptional regulator n=1 Tax=Pengzhenrongella sicca TaxID=2819238 RepID=A0A8A4ZJU4_9MICO|nr:TetR/AcrR family transcriptional regulator [Pengzhenrongella sicca]QTE30807.1 TetR/AcrR family transcriptional regulator [Pengzhenrongella sicca]
MGRTATFESAQAVRAARDLFWDRGFEAASIADLERATGLNRSSLYHAFGSKRGLFDAAVADYLETVVRPRLLVLRDGAGTSGLLAYVDGLRLAIETLPADSPRRGCLLVNCAAGLAGHDDAARAVVDAYRAELTAALRQALAAASDDDDDARLGAHARTLAAASMSAMLLARVNPGAAAAVLGDAREQILAWSR